MATFDENIGKVNEILYCSGILEERIGCTIQGEFDKKKLRVSWVPRISQQYLDYFKEESVNSMRQFITLNEL